MIRRYGPGKFNTILDKYVYEMTLDGGGEELGDVESFNHYSLVHLGKEGLRYIARMAREDITHEHGKRHGALTLEEARLIRKSYGAIVEVNNQGFVNVVYFSTKKALDKKWEKLEKEWSEMAGEESWA